MFSKYFQNLMWTVNYKGITRRTLYENGHARDAFIITHGSYTMNFLRFSDKTRVPSICRRVLFHAKEDHVLFSIVEKGIPLIKNTLEYPPDEKLAGERVIDYDLSWHYRGDEAEPTEEYDIITIDQLGEVRLSEVFGMINLFQLSYDTIHGIFCRTLYRESVKVSESRTVRSFKSGQLDPPRV